jgi:plastocyanin
MSIHSHSIRKSPRNCWRGAVLAAAFLAFASAAQAAPKASVHTVLIDGMQFSPQTLEVNAGDTVIWKNKDPYPHTATSSSKGFDSGTILSGREWKTTVKERGTFSYVCTLHQTMKAVLVVK